MEAIRYDVPRSELIGFVPSGVRRLLDVGCAAGSYLAELGRHRPDIELWGVEPVPENATAARQHVHQLVQQPFPAAVSQLPAGAFDVVTFNDVLEHLVEPGEALDATAPLLTDSGVVIASIPNVRHWNVTWPLVFRGAWDYEDIGLLDRTHVRFFTKRTMQELFTDRGWTVLDITGINRRWYWHEGWERRKLKLVRRLAGGRLDDFFYVQYAVTARPPTA